jgi:hypothetical protein
VADPLAEGAPDLVVIQIGSPEQLDAASLSEAIAVFILAAGRYPAAKLAVTVGGYDEDPRSVWEIPEAAARFRAFADGCFVSAFDPLVGRLEDTSIATFVQCGAWPGGHPWRVEITP